MASDEQIRELAYFIWKEEGCPDGKDSEHYFQAKRVLEEREKEQLSTYEEMSPPPSAEISPSAVRSKRPVSRGRKPRAKKSKE